MTPATPLPEPARRPRHILVVLVCLGLLLFALDPDADRLPRYLVAMAVAAFAVALPFRDRFAAALDRRRTPTPPRARRLTFVTLFLLSACYFLLSATIAGRDLFPIFHDEHMYLLQARLLSTGRPWLPPHELAPFFDSFNVITRPVYAATYFPGTALLYVPGLWLHVPPYVTSILITALAVAMLHPVMTELFDGVAGILAALLAIALPHLRALSVMTMSHTVMLLLLLLAVWSYLRWRTTRHLPYAAAFGACAGLAAITRPLDAVCLVGPFCALFILDVLPPPATPRRALITLATIVAAAAPFLLLQLTFDKAVTNSYLRTPFTQYARDTFPGLSFGGTTPPLDSPSPLPQVRDYYHTFLRPDLVHHATTPLLRTWLAERLASAADVALPAHALLILLPLGLIPLHRPARATLAAGLLTVPLAYALYPSWLAHYALVCAPAFITLTLAGESVARRSLPRALAPALPIFLATLCLASLPELTGTRDPIMQAPYLADVNAKLSRLDHTPAVVLFHYDPRRTDVHEEPVYNLDTPNPDDSPVIRAQDLGPETNKQIFSYYAARQPNRYFYLYNRTTTDLTPLGYARDLAK